MLERSFAPVDGEMVGIAKNLDRGLLKAIALTTINYTTGQTVTWVQRGRIRDWERPLRRSVVTRPTRLEMGSISEIPAKVLYTVGHSNRTAEDFLALLLAHGIQKVVDIRTIPASRHNPQFAKNALRETLREACIGYAHLPALGGLRHAAKDSVNLGWTNASFRGYADYMATREFARGLARLQEIAAEPTTAMMCAEAVPWRCHRSLVADALTVEGWLVLHIQSRTTAAPHALTPFLEVHAGKLLYPKKPR